MHRAFMTLWSVATAPRRFFQGHTPRRSSLRRALVAAAASGAVGLLVAGLALVRATGAGPAVAVGGLLFGGLIYLFLVGFLGGLVLMKSAGLDLRAFEVVAWAWTPAGAVGLLLLPLAWYLPLIGLALGSVAVPLWHLIVVNGALGAWSAERAPTAMFWYLAAVFALPTALLASLFALFTR